MWLTIWMMALLGAPPEKVSDEFESPVRLNAENKIMGHKIMKPEAAFDRDRPPE